MKIQVDMKLLGYCDMGSHNDCAGARIMTYDTRKVVLVCTCMCHDTNITDHDKPKRRLPIHIAEPTQIKLPLSGVTFPY